MIKHVILISLSFLTFQSILAQQKPKTWYKGNLHTHSYWSDGDEFPEMIMDWYKNHDYQFVGLSDHNVLAAGEKWKKITHSKLYEEGFEAYLAKYGAWVNYRYDSGRITARLKTLDEYRPMFEGPSFLILKSEEITSRLGEKHVHVNATNIQEVIGAQTGTTIAEVMQHSVDAVLAQRKQTGIPMIPHINHPNFFYSISIQDMIDLRGEQFFEVYNGHPMVNNYGDSLRPGMEVMWDRINIAYRLRNQPLMYGLATDDSHNYHQFGAAYSNAGRGWVMVNSESLQPASLIKALEAGDFYASTGVTLDRVEYQKNVIEVAVHPETGVQYVIEFIGVKKGEAQGKTIQKTAGPITQLKVTRNYLFVRARITSSKSKPNPFQEGDYEMAWTQPVFFKE